MDKLSKATFDVLIENVARLNVPSGKRNQKAEVMNEIKKIKSKIQERVDLNDIKENNSKVVELDLIISEGKQQL